jgi:hypothetical protein
VTLASAADVNMLGPVLFAVVQQDHPECALPVVSASQLKLCRAEHPQLDADIVDLLLRSSAIVFQGRRAALAHAVFCFGRRLLALSFLLTCSLNDQVVFYPKLFPPVVSDSVASGARQKLELYVSPFRLYACTSRPGFSSTALSFSSSVCCFCFFFIFGVLFALLVFLLPL